MARALVEVALDGVEEKAALMLESGETAELAIVNKDPQRVLCEVTVEHLNGVLNFLVAVELGGRRLYLGRSSRAGESISAEIEPGGVEILRVRFVAPPRGNDEVQVRLRVVLRALPAATARGKETREKHTMPKLLPVLVHEKP
jgi:hypothetical protein